MGKEGGNQYLDMVSAIESEVAELHSSTATASATPNHTHPVSSSGKMDMDDVDASTVTMMHPAWANLLVDIQPRDHSDYEEPLWNYLENTPGPDEHGEWDIQKARVWLEVGTVSDMIQSSQYAYSVSPDRMHWPV